MGSLDRFTDLFKSKSTKPEGCIGRDRNGVEIWDRDGQNVIESIFPESSNYKNRNKIWEYYFHPSGTRFEDTLKIDHRTELVQKRGGILSLDEFFSSGAKILELGCGGGQAAVDLARKYRNRGVTYLAGDHEMGEEITEPVHLLPNLVFKNMDWNQIPIEDGSVERILSRQGVVRYGGERAVREITRVAKIGAILRGDGDNGMYGRRNFFDYLYEMGWDVWRLKGSYLITAKKVK